MTMTNGGDQTAQLTVLGTGRLPQPEGGPRAGLLEVFPNRFPHRPYVVSMAFPEYTSLCPVTGQPDFGTIVVEFIPDQKCVESKSFKLFGLLLGIGCENDSLTTVNLLNDLVQFIFNGALKLIGIGEVIWLFYKTDHFFR